MTDRMTDHKVHRLRCRFGRAPESGYVAIVTALLMLVMVGCAAFVVDVGRWYLTGTQEQRAADAAALGGVPSLPGDQTTAFATAQRLAASNGYANGSPGGTSVATMIDGKPTRLRVTVSRTVDNIFGPLLGQPKTTITRTAVADFAGPVPMGSPCNEFGNDPVADGRKSSNCTGSGAFWANVGSVNASKASGDAYQNGVCASGYDGCSGGVNTDYDANGYFYTVTLTKPIANLTIQAFDAAWVEVGDLCNSGNLTGANKIPAGNTLVSDPATIYATGQSSGYCTGDVLFTTGGAVDTQFTVRDPGPNPWDPLSFPIDPGLNCQQTFKGYTGKLSVALDTTNPGYQKDVAKSFRQWSTLCTIPNAQPGTYMVQVKTNGIGNPSAAGHNRFALRAFGSGSSDNDSISLAAYNKMAIYANAQGAQTKFYLARVPSGAAGQVLNVRLYDIGDSTGAGTITILKPVEFGTDAAFSNCSFAGAAATKGTAGSCSITADSTYNGKWATISVPIPSSYSCTDSDATKCWVRLEYAYGSGNQPSDTTSWTASIAGDPVRLVQ